MLSPSCTSSLVTVAAAFWGVAQGSCAAWDRSPSELNKAHPRLVVWEAPGQRLDQPCPSRSEPGHTDASTATSMVRGHAPRPREPQDTSRVSQELLQEDLPAEHLPRTPAPGGDGCSRSSGTPEPVTLAMGSRSRRGLWG